jgi:antitoxin component HigA of HigAB toxin-antitoxin module
MLTFITLGTNRHHMPAITASLSETGYEGYKSIPKGMRSKVIDKMMRDYALKKTHVYREMEGQVSVQEVLNREQYHLQTIKTLYQQLEEATK